MDVTVSEPAARYFYDQVVGEHPGDMARIPNHPVLYGLAKAHGVSTEMEFARFLRQAAKHLEKDQPF